MNSTALWCQRLSAVALCGFAASVSGQQDRVEARVFVTNTASNGEILALHQSIVAVGAVVNGFAAGNVFNVTVAPGLLATLRGFPRVSDVKAYPAATGAPAPQPSRLFGLGVRAPTTADEAALVERETAARDAMVGDVLSIAPNRLASLRTQLGAATGGGASLPVRVDNSLSPHFPPIGEQEGRSSCVAWAICYYWSSYSHALDEGLDITGNWLPRNPACEIVTFNPVTGRYEFDPVKFAACPPTIDPPQPSNGREHIASPAFLYPLINNGEDRGVWTHLLPDAIARLNDIGCASWQSKPYDPWQFDSVTVHWPTEAQWIDALKRRTQSPAGTLLGVQQFNLGTAGQLELLKQHLANGQIAITAGVMTQNLGDFGNSPQCQMQGGCPGINGDVLFSSGGTSSVGGHAVTIVGYDDDKPYTDESNQPRKGALLIANSGGPGWGTYNSLGSTAVPGPDPSKRGFFWVSYDHASSLLRRVWSLTDRPHYRPRLLAAARLEKANRSGIGLRAAVGLVTSPTFTSHELFPAAFADTLHALGSAERVVLDLTDGLPSVDWTRPVAPLYLRFSAASGSMQNTEFLLDRLGSGGFVSLISPDPFKAVRSGAATACTDVVKDGDVNGDRRTDSQDVQSILTPSTRTAVCVGDPRDLDKSGTITIFDARAAVLKCTIRGCW